MKKHKGAKETSTASSNCRCSDGNREEEEEEETEETEISLLKPIFVSRDNFYTVDFTFRYNVAITTATT